MRSSLCRRGAEDDARQEARGGTVTALHQHVRQSQRLGQFMKVKSNEQ